MISLSQFILAPDHIPFTLMGLSLGEHSSVLRSSFVWPFQFLSCPLFNVSLYLSPNLNCPICFFQWPFNFNIASSIKLLHRFSDLYSFHKSYSSQVSIYLTLGTSYRCTKGYFTQCRGVAHNSTFSDFPQSA